VLDESKDKLILDPYMGSGTTAIAAKLLGHNYIGIDISPEYISLAEKRIANFDSHRQLVRNEMNIHNVEKTFKDRKKAGAWADVIKKKPNCANDFIDIKNRQKT
jgi:modification methylase